MPFDDPSTRVVLNKVMIGKFVMPSLPSDVQDLIRRMLTVDPNKRITISEIKQHPCFHRNLPAGYVIPNPLPFPAVSSPISISDLSPTEVSVLGKIGFSNLSELKSELECPENTMAKVFVHMLTSNCDLEQLPWDESDSARDHSQLDSSSFIINPSQNIYTSPGSFHNAASYEGNSFVSHPIWDYEEANVMSVLLEKQAEIDGRTMWHIMRDVQVAANDCGLQWFHPNRITIYARTQDATFYASVFAMYLLEWKIKLCVRLHKGQQYQFEDFADRLFQVLGI